MKRPSERGTFGLWLVTERKARDLTPTEVRNRLREQRGFAMAHSTYAMIESGSRQPTDEQRGHLVAFFGTEPAAEPQPATSDSILAALTEQTQLLAKLWPAVTELVAELRESRRDAQVRAEAVAELLAEQTLALRDLLGASSTPGESTLESDPARQRMGDR